jgi:hypothetical protein
MSDRAAMIEATTKAVEKYLAFRTYDETDATDLATVAVDAALAAGYVVGAEGLARLFHETYEYLAPYYDYETRKQSAVPWDDVPANNKALMAATARAVLAAGCVLPDMLERRCPDDGTCHHDCAARCFRVDCCDPLSGVFVNDKWPSWAGSPVFIIRGANDA